MKRKILASWIMCPDGTMIPSFHRHDYRTHTSVDEDGSTRESMIDGGDDYLKRGGKFTDMTVYEDDPFEVIRRFLCRGGRGEDGKQPLTYVPLCRINDSWLEALIKYEADFRPDNKFLAYYRLEELYRKKNNIKVD